MLVGFIIAFLISAGVAYAVIDDRNNDNDNSGCIAAIIAGVFWGLMYVLFALRG